ncbi:MAG TPA: DNA mismatch repair protein MutL, partial [Erysipelotrichaceae bacterium]|nr:DNA mismatch repair protein MutL [Erysipelotrichaceae bacterium]
MSRIVQLDEQTANMIAAGEVVERPQGVVKELVENAIDAGSTRITIAVREGGLASLTVTDDGCGMDSKDAVMAFQRHATSKIRTQTDLWRIHTLG